MYKAYGCQLKVQSRCWKQHALFASCIGTYKYDRGGRGLIETDQLIAYADWGPNADRPCRTHCHKKRPKI